MHIDTGNTGFMLLCCSLVMLMTPGLAFFYGGLVGRKNVLAIMIQSFVSMGWTTVLWWAVGFSLCFSGDMKSGSDFAGIIGNFHWAGLRGITLDVASFTAQKAAANARVRVSGRSRRRTIHPGDHRRARAL